MTAYVSARRAAALCGCSERTIRNWIAACKLSAEKSVGGFLIDPDALRPLMASSARMSAGAERKAARSADPVQAWSADSAAPALVEHEQDRRRPAVVLSADDFNSGPTNLLTIVPFTTRDRRIRFHVRLEPPQGGLKELSFALPEQLRSISGRRLIERWARLRTTSLMFFASMLAYLLWLVYR